MSTSRAEIHEWLKSAKEEGATHVIVVCDTFDHSDFPVLVRPGEDAHDRCAQYDGKNMQRVMEIYALHLPLEAQLNEARSFHLESPSD